MRVINWGIIGTGTIAHKFATALSRVENAKLYGVGSRTIENAKAFQTEFNVTCAYGNYEELANDPYIDVVYIATPHPFHKENAILCINAGIAILCEKPFTLNAKDAKEIYELAQAKKVFIMEAMWTKFLPTTKKIHELLPLIGEVRMVKADFSIRLGFNPTSRLMDINLGGGALLDLGIYPLTFATMVLGYPTSVESLVHIGETNVDEQSVIIMKYELGELAIVTSASQVEAPHDAYILGTNGKIHVPSFWNAQKAYLHVNGEIKEFNLPFTKNGYEYEIEEVNNCLRIGKLESDINPMTDTIKVLEIMDKVRSDWNLKYPME
ncbi:MAG: gfo/Idh/MocA family oxidoreductase [Haloplasmataceae bacterium]|jgi:predicted dehydrogenase|nr:gfo/Idh/MocA family oxidoreductase [Haloplasmataceae bacterium]